MESQRYENLLKKAQNRQLSSDDINDIFLAMHNKASVENMELVKSIRQNTRALQDIEEEYPLLPPEADDLSNAVKRKGVHVLGGKKSAAYQNVDIRRAVYRDIYGEVKRQYGLINENGTQMSYKKLKQKNLGGALTVVESYTPPIALENMIIEENDLDFID